MQSDKAIRYGLLSSTIAAGIAVVLQVSAAPYQEKPLSCRFDDSMTIVDSVDAMASYQLGQNYELGEGVEKSLPRSYSWFCNGALQKHPDSQLQVAMMLLEGRGVEKDVPRGMHWMNRAAQNGNHDAELALGILLVDSDPMRSAVLFKRSAAAGNLYANHRLAELYYYGMGVPQDYQKAQELSELGVASGFEKSKELLTRIRLKQDAGEYATAEPVPVAESIPKIQNPPEEEKKTENSGNLLKSILSVLPGLGKSAEAPQEQPSEVAQQVEIETSEPDVDNSQEISSQTTTLPSKSELQEEAINLQPTLQPLAVSVAPVITATPVTDTPKPEETIALNTPSDLPVLKKEDLVTAPNREVTKQAELEEELVKAAEKEIKEMDTAVVSPAEVPLATEQAVPDTSASKDTVSQSQSAAPEGELQSAESETAKFTALNQPVRDEDFLRGGSWVDQQPNMRYSIQLVQASQVDGIMKFIRKHGLEDKAYYIHAKQDGQYRYILLYGDYPNNRTSKKVAKTLPQAVQDAGYWIRTYGDLRRSYTISD